MNEITNVLLAQIAHLDNPSRDKLSTDKQSFRDMEVSLLEDGWTNKGILQIWPASATERKQAAKKREAQLEKLMRTTDKIPAWQRATGKETAGNIESVPITGEQAAEAYRQMYYNENGPIEPEYITGSGFHRQEATVRASALRIMNGEQPILTVPVEIIERPNAKVALEKSIRDNMDAAKTTNPMTPRDQLRSALLMYGIGLKQADFRRMFKVGAAQKLWALCQINKRYKGLDFAERCFSNDEETGISIATINKEMARYVGEYGTTLIVGSDGKPTTGKVLLEDEVVPYLVGDKPKPIMTKDNIAAWRNQTSVAVVAYILDAVLLDDKLHCSELVKPENATMLNEVCETIVPEEYFGKAPVAEPTAEPVEA